MIRALYRRFVAWFAGQRWGSVTIKRLYWPLDKAVYRLTGGRRGLGPTRDVLLLTSIGRKTGQPRRNPLMYLEHADSFWVMGSNFGGERHPAWTQNLLANPEASVQVGRRTEQVIARLASNAERQELWSRLVEVYPPWDAYTGWTDRAFRLFELKPR
jgi:deazaflavin-dependent oxidoreductase (nitroreductase family)